jgi:hypothetical protein
MAKLAYQKNMPRKAQGVSTRGSSLNAEAIRLKEMDREPKKKQIHQDLEAARRRDDNGRSEAASYGDHPWGT